MSFVFLQRAVLTAPTKVVTRVNRRWSGLTSSRFVQVFAFLSAITFGLPIPALAQAPTITAISAPRQVVAKGQSLTLSVTAPAATSYQWKRNGRAIPSATAASYTISSASPLVDNGWYQAIATNGSGSTTSAVVSLNVGVSPSQVLGWGLNNSGQISIPGGLSAITAVAAGASHTLALRSDGSVAAWGYNGQGATSVPVGLTDVVGIGAGDGHSVALRSDGTVAAWGNSGSGQTTVPLGLTNVAAIAVGHYHCLALKSDGLVAAWGDNGEGQRIVPAGLSAVVEIAAGSYHNLALKADGTVVGWGYNFYGQATTPLGLSGVVRIAAGAHHSLALKADGSVVAWGRNEYGETAIPPALGNVAAIAAGGSRSLAMKADGSVLEWGGGLGSGASKMPAQLTNVALMVAGPSHSIVVRDAIGDSAPSITVHPVGRSANLGQTIALTVTASGGTAPLGYQWRKGGANIVSATNATYTLSEVTGGIAGSYDVVVTNYLGSATSNPTALAVNTTPVVNATDRGRYILTPSQSLTLTLDAAISGFATVQWRRNGMTLPGATGRTLTITNVTPATSGYYQAVFDEGSGAVTSATIFVRGAPATTQFIAWGGTSSDQLFPASLSNAVSIATKVNYVIALKSDGSVITSNNDYGVPTGLGNVAAVSIGGSHRLALKADGTVVQWGSISNGEGQPPADLLNVVSVAAGNNHSLALKNDGTVVAWGNGTFGATAVPVGLTNVAGIAGGNGFSLALKADGTVVGWGNNGSGQSSIPPDLTNVVAIAAGNNFSLALKSDGTVIGWGASGTGPAVIPIGITDVVAIAAGNSHALALKTDGSVVGWGANNSGQASPPAELNSVFAIAGGNSLSIVLRDSSGDLAPTITTHPTSVTAFAGQSVTFSVSVNGGTSLLSYQWRKDGVALAGATHTTLSLPVVSTANAGNYDVVVTNQLGVVPSQIATLAVSSTSAVTTSLTGQQILSAGQSLTLTATAALPGTVTFQWRRNGRTIAGATGASLTISNAAWRDTGAYQVVATNSVGPVTSAAVFVGVSSTTQLRAWGDNSNGQTTVPVGLSGIMEIAAGTSHSLALKSDGTVAAWGRNDRGQTNVPAGLVSVVGIAAGESHSVALKADGTVVTWGLLNYTLPALTNVTAIASTGNSAIALRADGTVVVWDTGNVRTDVPSGLNGVVAVDGGYSHYLALKGDGTLVAWGDNNNGKATVPAGLADIVAISAGAEHSLALKSDGTVVAWGRNGNGESSVPVGLSGVTAISAGYLTSFALKSDGTVVSWGNGSSAATLPVGLGQVMALSAGVQHALALRDALGDTVPSIATQPIAITASQGQPATFSIVAGGTPSPTFQWRKNGVNLTGATNASFTISSVQTSDAGSYDVVVANYIGTVTSTAVALSLTPSVLVNLSVRLPTPPEGVSSTFTISGTAPKSVLIRGVGPALTVFGVPGALADPQLTLINSTTGAVVASNNDWGGTTALSQAFTRVGAFAFPSTSKDSALLETLPPGTYTAQVSGVGGTAGEVLVEVYDADLTRISTFSYLSFKAAKPSGSTLVVGAVLTGTNPSALLIRAAGPSLGTAGALVDPTLALYSGSTQIASNDNWSGSAITAAASQVGAFPFVASSRDSALLATLSPGSFSAHVTGIEGGGGIVLVEFFDASATATAALPYFVVSPTPQTMPSGANVTFSALAGGTSPIGYEWRRNGTAIAGATNASLTLNSVQAIDTASYDVVATNSAGSATSQPAALTVVLPAPPTIVSATGSGSINVGLNTVFTVNATGAAPLTYQWWKDGVAIAGATNSTHPINNVQVSHSGVYTAVVSNIAGSATSTELTLNVIALPPAISAQPVGGTRSVGGSILLTVGATGSPILGYQWQRNGVVLPFATNANLGIPNAQTHDTGDYVVIVSNAFGSATSLPARLTVVPKAVSFSARLVLGTDGAWGFFTIEGTASKQVLLRAIGPGLAPFGISGLAADPHLAVFSTSGELMAVNNDWSAATNVATISQATATVGAFALVPFGRDAAILQTFAPGSYAVRATLNAGGGGIAFLELYDADGLNAGSTIPFVAVRGRVAPGDGALIGGLGSNGRGPKSFLLRVVGPSLGAAGALLNPSFLVVRDGTLVGINDDWDVVSADGAAVSAAVSRIGAFTLPAGSRDAAVVLTGNMHAGAHTVQVGSAAGTVGNVLLELHDLDSNRPAAFAPMIVSPPVPQSLSVGALLALSVRAHGTGALTYQWKRDSLNLDGATSATLSIPSALVVDGGAYSVSVTNSSGTATSVPAMVVIHGAGGDFSAAQDTLGEGYVRGGTISITNTLTYTGTADSLGWLVTLPTGWSFASDGGSSGNTKPGAGATGTLEWAWTAPPTSPVTFAYTVNVPAATTGDQILAAQAVVRAGETVRTITATPNPMVISPASLFHSADTDGDRAIDLFELTRVIELYNTRNGTVRTGAYRVDPSNPEDGFGADAPRAPGATVALTRYHSADTRGATTGSPRDGALDLFELTRVIELYNTRAGTVRTGRYHLQSGTEDGFAAGP